MHLAKLSHAEEDQEQKNSALLYTRRNLFFNTLNHCFVKHKTLLILIRAFLLINNTKYTSIIR